jgi:pimeloyl-ACP methyl ester carboxylesterase
VLVGQSIGGILVRTFARQYPKEVSGMVLVGSTHEDTQLNLNGKIQQMRELSQGRTIPPIQTAISLADKSLSPEERQEIENFIKQVGPAKIEEPFNRLPPDIQKMRLWALAQLQHYADGSPFGLIHCSNFRQSTSDLTGLLR